MPRRSPKDISAIFRDGREIDLALKRAVRDAIRYHKLMGHSIPEWRDGQVVWLKPEEIVIPEVEEAEERTEDRTGPEDTE